MSLDVRNTLKRLEAYNDSPSPILSVYFHLPVPKLYTEETITDKLHSVIDHNLTLKERKDLQENIEYIEGFMLDYQQGRGEETLAFFTGGTSLFEVIHLPYKIEDQAVVSHSPFLEPLLHEQADYRRYLVIFVDRSGAKFFTSVQGIIEDQDEVIDKSVPQNIHQDASEALYANREDKIDRHIQDHLHRHFQRITHRIQSFIGNQKLNGVIIAGHKNLFPEFIKTLPKQLQERIVAKCTSEIHTNVNELLEKSNRIIEEVNRKFDEQQSPYIFQ